MEVEKQLKNYLNHQYTFINDINVSLHYLTDYKKYFDKNGEENLKDLNFIYTVLRDQTILNLCKLYHHTESYSFYSYRKLLVENKTKLERFYENLKIAGKLFEKLNILKIRNKHVGHLDRDRTKESIDWSDIQLLNNYAIQMHDNINLCFFKTQSAWDFQNDYLKFLLKKDLAYKKIYQIWRKACRNLDENIPISEIKDLVNLKLDDEK